MSLKSELLKVLSRMPTTQTVRERKALLASVGFDRLGSQITWEGSNPVFFNELLDLLRSEGQKSLVSFLSNLVDSDWVGLEDKIRLNNSINTIQALTTEQWDREFWGASDAKALLRVPFVLPQLDVSTFTGREAELQQLEELLLEPQGTKICSIIGLSGGGGIGKSALACHFAMIHRDKFPDGVIGLKVNGKDIDAIAREFVRRSGEELDPEDERDASTLMQEVFAHRQMLLIFDNAIEASIKELRPGGNRCAVIVTTRNRNLSNSLDIPIQGAINLDPLLEEDSLRLLRKILSKERINTELEAAYEIIRLVGNLPLALQIAGATLRGRTRSLTDYAASLQQEKTRLSRLKVRDDDDLNVEASLNLSLELLSEEERDFFTCLSVCAESGFSRQIAMAASGCNDEWVAQEYLDRLYDLSLLNYSEVGENRFVLHTLIRLFARELASESSLLREATARHAEFFINLVKFDALDEEIAKVIGRELDNVMLAAQWVQQQETDSRKEEKEKYSFAICLQPFFEQYGYWQQAVEFMQGFELLAEQSEEWSIAIKFRIQQAKYLSLQRKFQQAETILSTVPNILDKIEDESSREISEAKYITTLGTIYVRQNRLDEAILSFQDAVEISQNLDDLESLAISLNSLGGALRRQRRLDQAEEILNQVLDISKKMNDQRTWGYALHNLGKVYQEKKDLDKALLMLEKSRNLFEKLNQKRSLLMVLTSIGYVLQEQGKIREAIETFQKSAALSEEIGDERDAAWKLILVGNALLEENRLEEARELFERQISISERRGDNRETAVGLNYLGKVLEKQGEIEEALKIYKQQIQISESCDDQKQLAIGLNSLGVLLRENNRVEESIQLFQRQLEISERIKDDYRSAIGLINFGLALQYQENFSEALRIFLAAKDLYKNLKNVNSLIFGLRELAKTLYEREHFKEALQAIESVIEICLETDNQLQLGISKNKLGRILQAQGKMEEAKREFLEQIEIGKTSDDMQQVASGLHCLGFIAIEEKDFDTAIENYEEVVEIHKRLDSLEDQVLSLNSLGIALHHKACFLLEKKIHSDEDFAVNIQQAITTLERSKSIFIQLDSVLQLAMVLHSLGRAYKKKGELTEAEVILQQSREILENEKDERSLAMVLNTLGSVLEKQQKWNEAGKVLRESINLAFKLEDKRGQAIIANSLGQVVAKQDNEEAFNLSQMYFRKSIELGEELKDKLHLAKAHTAMGQMLLAYQDFEQAVGALSKGFEIDESLSNIRGLRIVLPNLTYALSKLGRREEALGYCERALTVSPNYLGFLELRKKIQVAIARGIHQTFIKTGSILYIRCDKSGLRWGQILPDDGSPNIVFNEKYIGSKAMSKLIQGALVEVEVEERYGKLYATQIRVVEEEEEEL